MAYPRLKDLRHDNNYTQKQVGEFIHISQRTYSYYESGKRMVPPSILCALANLYDVSIDYLVGRTDDPAPPSPRRNKV